MFAFEGTATFDITIALLGQSATRAARIRYSYTPTWPFFDETEGHEADLPPAALIDLEIQTHRPGRRPMSDLGLGSSPGWVRIDGLLIAGVLPNAVLTSMLELMDEDARRQDRERRASANPTDKLEDQI